MAWRASGLSPSLAAASASLFVLWSVSQMLQWRWAPLPAWSAKGFGARDATSPCRAATPRTVWR